MDRYEYEAAFGAWDRTTDAMRAAIAEWFHLYYRAAPERGEDPCQRIAYTVVNKLVRTVFSEYKASAGDPFTAGVLSALDEKRREAVLLALIGGECGIKPCPSGGGFTFTLVPRRNMLVFARNSRGEPADVGLVERCQAGGGYFTLLERRRLGQDGLLTIENQLFRSLSEHGLGKRTPLDALPQYKGLPETYTFPENLGGLGMVWLKTPMVNCVDGSADGVSVYAAAAGLIHSIDRNEYQLKGEFDRGESRIIASADLLDDGDLQDHLFVGLDEDPDNLGLTIFSPQLREASFLARKQAYLRDVESLIGLKRGLLSEVEAQERTATEITSSQGDYNLTIMDFQAMWETALRQTVKLCGQLGRLYRVPGARAGEIALDWGNGVLYDEEKTWADYKDMVQRGLLKPEIALAWRFNLPGESQAELQAIRRQMMPAAQGQGSGDR